MRYLLFLFFFSGQEKRAKFKDLKLRQHEIKKEQKKELKNFKAEFAIIKNKIQTEARNLQRQKIREKKATLKLLKKEQREKVKAFKNTLLKQRLKNLLEKRIEKREKPFIDTR